MRRPLAILVAVAAAIAATFELVGESRAELENGVFTSRPDQLRLVVPRGWRATDQPSYPGLLLWMMRSQPPGQIVVTSERFTRELYCSWPVTCRATSEPLASKYACAITTKLSAQRLKGGPVQAGPRDNDLAGIPSVWFEYDDRKRFVRQAIAIGGGRAISLILSAPSGDARAAHVRAFDQTLRTLRLLTPEEAAPPAATPSPPPGDGGVVDAATALPDAGPGTMFESSPPPAIDPVGPCG